MADEISPHLVVFRVLKSADGLSSNGEHVTETGWHFFSMGVVFRILLQFYYCVHLAFHGKTSMLILFIQTVYYRFIFVCRCFVSHLSDFTESKLLHRTLDRETLEETCLAVLSTMCLLIHDDIIKLKHFPRYWPFVRGISTGQRWIPLTNASVAELRCFLWSAPE